MNKLEAADKLAEAGKNLVKELRYGPRERINPAIDVLQNELTAYQYAPAIPPLEKILAAMEHMSQCPVLDHTSEMSHTEAWKTLYELRKAVKP